MMRPAALFALSASLLALASGCSAEPEEARGSSQGAVAESEMLLLCPGLDAAHHVEAGSLLNRGEAFRCVIERCTRGFANLESGDSAEGNPGFFDDHNDGCETNLERTYGGLRGGRAKFDVIADGQSQTNEFIGEGSGEVSIHAREASSMPRDLDLKVTLTFRSPMTFEMKAFASGLKPCWDANNDYSPDHLEGAVVRRRSDSDYPELDIPQTRTRTLTMRLHVSEKLMRDNAEWFTLFIEPRWDATALGDVSYRLTVESGSGVGAELAPQTCLE